MNSRTDWFAVQNSSSRREYAVCQLHSEYTRSQYFFNAQLYANSHVYTKAKMHVVCYFWFTRSERPAHFHASVCANVMRLV